MSSIFSIWRKPAPGLSQAGQLAEHLERARTLHQQRELVAAATLYREIITAHSGNAEAHYRYANLLKDQNALEQALVEYDRAIALKPDYAFAYCNRAVVLGFMKRLPEALASYDRAVAIAPTDAIAQCNRAMLLLALGNKDAALAGFDAAVALDPKNYTAYLGRGGLLQERTAWADSLAAYDQAIAINSENPASYYNRGTVLQELAQTAAALDSFERSIALNPNFALAHGKRAQTLQELGQLPAALDSYDRALALDPSDASTHSNRGVLLQKMGQLTAALAGYDQAIALNPKYAEGWFNRGGALADLENLDMALASYDRAITEKPDYARAYVNRGVTLQSLGLVPEAVASYEKCIAISPKIPEAHYNLALASLTLGNYATGWAEYEWRWLAEGGPIFREKRDFVEPLWVGNANISGKTILLYGEQGLGDSLQFCRYVELVAKLGARVILEVPGPLVSLCSTLSGVAQVIPYGSPLPGYDFQCPLMSLPWAFNSTLKTIPSTGRYLHSDPGKVAAWRQRLGERVKPRIGLTWSGNQTAGTNRKRHFALSNLAPHLPADFDYFCLQTEVVEADQVTLAKVREIRQFNGLLRDFTDTAALCECMDMVVSVDTSVAHMSGALGKSTWVLLASTADWRWLLDRDDSPWYQSVRVFRQRYPGDWNGVFERVAAALSEEI
jgi:tetratricopeptide (TPR) repeat protein